MEVRATVMVTIDITSQLRIAWPDDRVARLFDKIWRNLLVDRFGKSALEGFFRPELSPPYYRRYPNAVCLPRGLLWWITDFLDRHNVNHRLRDWRVSHRAEYCQQPHLRPYQYRPVRQLRQYGGGIVKAPPGSGKTIMAFSLIASSAQSALWMTHSPELAFQVAEKARRFLGIGSFTQVDEVEGLYLSDRFSIVVNPSQRAFERPPAGVLIFDEAHRLPDEPTFMTDASLVRFVHENPAAIRIGLCAEEPSGFARHLIGPIVARLGMNDLSGSKDVIYPRYIPVSTQHRGTATNLRRAISQLAQDDERNHFIAELVRSQYLEGHSVLVLSPHTGHCRQLHRILTGKFSTPASLVAGTAKSNTSEKLVAIRHFSDATCRILIGDQRLFEGMDFPGVTRLILALPTLDPSRVVQQVGRAMRSMAGKTQASVYDLCDRRPSCLQRLSAARGEILRAALDWQYDSDLVPLPASPDRVVMRHGEPYISGTRVRVADIAEALQEGLGVTDVVQRYPELSYDDVAAAAASSGRKPLGGHPEDT